LSERGFPLRHFLRFPYEDLDGAARLPHTFRALKHRNFRIFWTSRIVSLTGNWMQTVAQGWLVYRLTDSPLYLGLVGFAQYLPVLLFALFGGVLADRFPKRNLLLFTNAGALLQALSLAILTSSGQIQVWQIIVLAFLLGTVQALDAPTRQSIMMELVGPRDLLNAIALNSSAFNSARAIGPLLAGILVSLVGEAGCFYINALGFSVVLGALLRIKLPLRPVSERAAGIWTRLRDGLSYARHDPTILTLLSLVLVASIFGVSYGTLLPVFARDILRVGPKGYGLLMTATGIGALSAALLLASRRSSQGKGRWLTLGNLLFPIMLLLLAASRLFLLSWLALVGVGFGLVLQNANVNVLLQTLSSERYRGRVMSLYALTFMGMMPLGSLQAGAVANAYGAPLAVTAGALICLLFGLAILIKRPQLRRLE